MRSSVALVAFFSIALLACFTEARKDPRDILQPAATSGAFTEQNEHLGSNTLKDFESKPESVLILYHGDKANLQEGKPYMRDFESKPESILFLYRGDKANLQEGKPHMKDIESKPGSVLLYHKGTSDDAKQN